MSLSLALANNFINFWKLFHFQLLRAFMCDLPTCPPRFVALELVSEVHIGYEMISLSPSPVSSTSRSLLPSERRCPLDSLCWHKIILASFPGLPVSFGELRIAAEKAETRLDIYSCCLAELIWDYRIWTLSSLPTIRNSSQVKLIWDYRIWTLHPLPTIRNSLTLYCPMTPYGVMTFVNSP